MIRFVRTALVLLAVAVPAPALIVACRDQPATWSEADRVFVSRMIPHHHLGMVLTDLAAQRAADVRLRRLVFEMSGYHQSELGLLDGWARGRGISESKDFPGDLADAEIDALAGTAGEVFDRFWLELMIRHHEGALQIAAEQIDSGTVAEARDLARSVARVQSGEIAEMERLLGELCGAAGVTPPAAHCDVVATPGQP